MICRKWVLGDISASSEAARVVVIDGNAKGQLAGIGCVESKQALLHLLAHHRAHGIGEDEHLVVPIQRRPRHVDHLRVHEGFAAGEGNFGDRPAPLRYLIEKGFHLLRSHVDQSVVGRAALDVAVGAFDIAERPGVEPKRFRRGQADFRAWLAFGCDVGVLEFAFIGGDHILHGAALLLSFCALFVLALPGRQENGDKSPCTLL